MTANQCTDLDLDAIRTRDDSWTANYAHMHRSDGYGQAAADRRVLLAEIERLRTIVRSVNRIISQNEPYRWKVERIVAALGETS